MCKQGFSNRSQIVPRHASSFLPLFFPCVSIHFFPFIWHNLFALSRHIVSNYTFPNILITWLYSYSSCLHTSFFQVHFHSYSCTCFYLLYLYPWSWQYLMVPQSPFLWWQWQLFFQMAHGMTQHVVQSGILQVWESFKTELFWARVSSSKFISFPLPFPCVLMCLRFSKAGLEVTFILVLS